MRNTLGPMHGTPGPPPRVARVSPLPSLFELNKWLRIGCVVEISITFKVSGLCALIAKNRRKSHSATYQYTWLLLRVKVGRV
jgi:hypothetical protein